MRYHYLPVPNDIGDSFRARGVERVIATINGFRCRRALVSDGIGGLMIIAGRQLLRDAKVAPGDVVPMIIEPDPEPKVIDLSEEFEAVLALDEEAASRFAALTVGQRRGLAHYLSSAVRPETRLKRAQEVATKLRTYTLYGDRSTE
jgi:hypothetical protein